VNQYINKNTTTMNRILILLLLGSTAYAQRPEKEAWLVGADVANLTVFLPKATQNRVLSGNVALLGGCFVSDRVVLGASLPVEWVSAPTGTVGIRFNSAVYGLNRLLPGCICPIVG